MDVDRVLPREPRCKNAYKRMVHSDDIRGMNIASRINAVCVLVLLQAQYSGTWSEHHWHFGHCPEMRSVGQTVSAPDELVFIASLVSTGPNYRP